MKVKFKEFFKNNFRKSPKAKIILAIVAVVSVISVVAVICLRKTITVTIDGEKKTYATWIQSVEESCLSGSAGYGFHVLF